MALGTRRSCLSIQPPSIIVGALNLAVPAEPYTGWITDPENGWPLILKMTDEWILK